MHFFEVWSWCGRLSVFSRSYLGGIRQGIRDVKETAILTKRTFSVWEFLSLFYVLRFSSEWGLSGATLEVPSEALLHPSFFFGSSLVFCTEEIGKVQRNGILILGINYE